MQAENHRLNNELQLTLSKLDGIQRFLSGAETRASAIDVNGSKTRMPQIQPSTRVTSTSPMPSKTRVTPDQQTKAQTAIDPDTIRALHAILDYNDHTATSHGDQWAISFPVMKELLKQVGKATQPKIEAVLRAKSEMIDKHHRHHGLGQRHNRVHQGRSVSEIIHL